MHDIQKEWPNRIWPGLMVTAGPIAVLRAFHVAKVDIRLYHTQQLIDLQDLIVVISTLPSLRAGIMKVQGEIGPIVASHLCREQDLSFEELSLDVVKVLQKGYLSSKNGHPRYPVDSLPSVVSCINRRKIEEILVNLIFLALGTSSEQNILDF
ncbi:hypothetical protein VNO77_14234 [Canavalia gladiata]|uniref:Uncharacterized protein n=1 Tax=Canavalia gladiata TaxID=3824 RepID=A0AAN9LZ86_CANGL